MIRTQNFHSVFWFFGRARVDERGFFFELVTLKLVNVMKGRDGDSKIGGDIKKIDKVFLLMCGAEVAI